MGSYHHQDSRSGIILGFKLFYKQKSLSGSSTQITINTLSTRTKVVTELDKYTEYDLQVLAFTAVSDGPNSSVMSERTTEDSKKLFTVYFVYIF